ncbi:cyclase [Cystobacter fuscus]|uniref:Cyclase n=1 Tax=Cystobacter fuscus TaxID=43 RepID=A0A250J2B5_9BACT|nr:cyclase family protein [Cystobacter fuscus]ATB38124.1 cyclase [Cystobacter fuscus]
MSVLSRLFEKKTLARELLALSLVLGATAVQAEGPSLAEAYKALASRKMVDLTHSFSPSTPVWQGFGQATFTTASDPKTYRPYNLEKDGFRTTYYSMVGQYGTHVDPPAHFHENGITLDQIPLREMILPLVVLDITPLLGKDPNHAITVQDILDWEKKHGRVPEGSFAALRTDMYKDWGNPERFKRYPFPAWSLAAVQFLFEKRKITAIGHESLDTDITSTLDAEKWVLGQGRYQIEVMAHLDKVPPTGALIVVTWPKVANGLGFPARAFAIVP